MDIVNVKITESDLVGRKDPLADKIRLKILQDELEAIEAEAGRKEGFESKHDTEY